MDNVHIKHFELAVKQLQRNTHLSSLFAFFMYISNEAILSAQATAPSSALFKIPLIGISTSATKAFYISLAIYVALGLHSVFLLMITDTNFSKITDNEIKEALFDFPSMVTAHFPFILIFFSVPMIILSFGIYTSIKTDPRAFDAIYGAGIISCLHLVCAFGMIEFRIKKKIQVKKKKIQDQKKPVII